MSTKNRRAILLRNSTRIENAKKSIIAIAEHFPTRRNDQADIINLADFASVSINATIQQYSKRICDKTGAILGETNSAELIKAYRISAFSSNESELNESLQACALGHVAPAWINTSGKNLAALASVDPVGYFIYTFCKLDKKQNKTIAQRFNYLQTKAQINTTLQSNLHNPELLRVLHIANELQRRLLSLFAVNNHLQFKYELAPLADLSTTFAISQHIEFLNTLLMTTTEQTLKFKYEKLMVEKRIAKSVWDEQKAATCNNPHLDKFLRDLAEIELNLGIDDDLFDDMDDPRAHALKLYEIRQAAKQSRKQLHEKQLDEINIDNIELTTKRAAANTQPSPNEQKTTIGKSLLDF